MVARVGNKGGSRWAVRSRRVKRRVARYGQTTRDVTRPRSKKKVKKKKLLELCSTGGSNSRPSDDTGNYETDALPTELVKQLLERMCFFSNRRYS
jgi:hypothetical protein